MRWVVAAVLMVVLVGPAGTSEGVAPVVAAGIPAAPACGTARLTVQPGLPAYMRNVPLPRAPDVPRVPFTVQLPLYPDAQPLTARFGQPIPEYEANPYLQTAVAEYRSSAGIDAVQSWYADSMRACGWKSDGSGLTDGDKHQV